MVLKAVEKLWLVELRPSPAKAVVSETLTSVAPADASRRFQAGTLIVVLTAGGDGDRPRRDVAGRADRVDGVGAGGGPRWDRHGDG